MLRPTRQQVDDAMLTVVTEMRSLRSEVRFVQDDVVRFGSRVQAAGKLVEQAKAAGLANVDAAELAAALGMP